MATNVWTGATSSVWNLAGNWSLGTVPTASDGVIITGTVNITGYDNTGVELDFFIVRNYSGTIGSESAYLQIDVANGGAIDIETSGLAYLDITPSTAPTTDVNIYKTAAAADPQSGLYLKCNVIGDVHIYGNSQVHMTDYTAGDVFPHDEGVILRTDSSFTADSVQGYGRAYIEGLCANIYAQGQDMRYTYSDTSPIATAVLQAENGATIYYDSNANVTAANCYGGTINGERSNLTPTFTAVNFSDGGSFIPSRAWTLPTSYSQPVVIQER